MAHQNIHVVGDEERLPKWAQRELENQRTTIATLHRKLKSFENAPEDSPVYMRDFASGDVSLPADRPFVFVFSDGDKLDVQLVEDELTISGSDGRINVMPQAANSIRIKVRGLFE